MESGTGGRFAKLYTIPLNRFSSELPHFKLVLDGHRGALIRLETAHKWSELQVELHRSNTTLKKLQKSVADLEHVSTKLQDGQKEDFETQFGPLHKKAKAIIQDFSSFHQKVETSLSAASNLAASEDSVPGASEAAPEEFGRRQLFLQEQELLEERREQLEQYSQLERDTADLHEIFAELGKATHEQAELVDTSAAHVEEAQENVTEGARQLALAARLSGGVAPVAGALIGGAIAGPLGMLAGAKIGSLAAVSGGVLGYVGGRLVNAGRRGVGSPPPPSEPPAASSPLRPSSAPADLSGTAGGKPQEPCRMPEQPVDVILADDVEEAEDALNLTSSSPVAL